MTEIDIEDPGVRRIVKAAARRLRRPGVDREDLIQQGYMGLLTAPERFDPGRCQWSTWVWQKASKAMETYLDLRQHALDFTRLDTERDILQREGPEPSPELVRLFGLLSDDEAEAVSLVCGMDGTPPRTCYAVALMLARGPSSPDSGRMRGLSNTVNSRYLRGLAKLRGWIDAERLRA